MRNIGLSEVSIKTAVRLMMEGSNYNQFQQIAKALEVPKSTFQSQLINNTLRVRDLQKISNLLGYEIKLEQKVRES